MITLFTIMFFFNYKLLNVIKKNNLQGFVTESIFFINYFYGSKKYLLNTFKIFKNGFKRIY